jgi:hypothetical protein
MRDSIVIDPKKVLFEDDFIAVRIVAFDPKSGLGNVSIQKKLPQVGFYYITVSYASGDSNRLDYNGENPNNPDPWDINSSHRNDAITKLEAKKAR